jgi:SM-20-related protein
VDLPSALAAGGVGVVPGFLPAVEVAAIRAHIGAVEAAGGFRAAAVGAGAARAVRPRVRGDRLAWIDAATPVEVALLARFEALRLALNEALGLGLFDLEAQYAIYPPGARYARHADRSLQGAERVVSVVLYLNEGWRAEDGGELVLYPATGAVRVAPLAGTLVAFRSERLEHEVELTRRERHSVVGWFRRRARLPT